MRGNHDRLPAAPIFRAELPASLLAPRQARATVRHALNAWGLDALSNDAELIASELVANAAEHADGTPIGLTIHQHAERGGRRGILCQIADAAPAWPPPGPGQPDRERGRGLQIVAALSDGHGIVTSPHGKTAWFTLTAQTGPTRGHILASTTPAKAELAADRHLGLQRRPPHSA